MRLSSHAIRRLGYATSATAEASSPAQRSVGYGLLLAAVGGAGLAAVASTSDAPVVSDVSFAASTLATPLLRLVDGETAHKAAIFAAQYGLVPRERRSDPECLQITVWGRRFANPLGLAAGFDKDAQAVDGLLGMGFGAVEVGSITPQPQPGNPQPRVFRLPEHKAVINRYGFNSAGVAAAEEQLLARRKQHMYVQAGIKSGGHRGGMLGVNLGKNKLTVDAASDYEIGIANLARFADYLVINVSSPNTPGLRALQGRKELDALLRRVIAARDALDYGGARPPPLVLKIAPDLTAQDLRDVAQVALARRVDGIIISNTTLSRPPHVATSPHGTETGGLSGAPLFEPSTRVLSEIYTLTRGRIPLIGTGGICSGHDAYRKIRAGASLVQVYTAFAFEGPPLVRRIKAELADCLAADGFACVADAVGADHKKDKRRNLSSLNTQVMDRDGAKGAGRRGTRAGRGGGRGGRGGRGGASTRGKRHNSSSEEESETSDDGDNDGGGGAADQATGQVYATRAASRPAGQL